MDVTHVHDQIDGIANIGIHSGINRGNQAVFTRIHIQVKLVTQ